MQRLGNSQITVGPSLLALVTRGICDNPLVIYREYLQNAVDALARYNEGVGSPVEITINRRERRVVILDYGPGLSCQECYENLLPVAHSKKAVGTDRGFRGIGRLSGLAFANSVTFLTRSRSCDPVTRVTWSGTDSVGWNNLSALTPENIQECVKVDSVVGDGYPEHFFQVEIDQVNRQAAGTLLNRDVVRAYISEVCPVPMDPAFPFVEEVQDLFDPGKAPYVQDIVFSDDPEPVHRQYGAGIQLSQGRHDQFGEFEVVRIPDLDGMQPAAVGWLAHSSYQGAIPKEHGIRGIRARVGNIRVGDEAVFDHLFAESRFNRWCVGELHILDPRIFPNARRDYFEPNPHLRNLENHLGPVFSQIAARCRASSSARHRQSKVLSDLVNLEELCDLMNSGYLTVEDRAKFASGLQQRLQTVRQTLGSVHGSDVHHERLECLESKIHNLTGCDHCHPLASLGSEEQRIYRQVFRAVVSESNSPALAKRIIQSVLAQV